jgi:CRISPR-associated protein Cas2
MPHKSTWIIAYDIRAPRRLQRVHTFLAKQAYALQYSVFAADLTRPEFERLKAELAKLIDPKEDDVRFYAAPPGADVMMSGRTRLPDGVLLFGPGAADLAGGKARQTSAKPTGGTS